MSLGHEKLDVYRLSIGYVAWVYAKSEALNGIHRAARDQWLRASQSIPLNIAEGNGRFTAADHARFLGIARSATVQSAAILDLAVARHIVDTDRTQQGRQMLERISAMLTVMLGFGLLLSSYVHRDAEMGPMRE